MRRVVRRGVLALILLAGWYPAPAAAQAVRVVPGTVHHQNIENAIKFLREHGDAAAAKEIEGRLADGKIYVDTAVAVNGETRVITGNISLSPGVAGNTLPFNRDKPLDPVADFEEIVELARTLYHENVHSTHQGVVDAVFLGENWMERQAWSQTIMALERWINFERQAHFDLFYKPRTLTMTPAAQARELAKIQTKIRVLLSYLGSYKENEYFEGYDGPWAEGLTTYWTKENTAYIEPRQETLTGGTPTTTTPTPTTPTTPTPPPSPPAPPKTDPPPSAPEPIPCLPCRPIGDQIRDLKATLRSLTEQANKAKDDAAKAEQRVAELNKRADGIDRELQRAAGTGGSSFDPTTGTTIDSYDQGNGTVKITVRDAAGNIVEERTRDSSARKAELRKQLDDTRAEIKQAQENAATLADAAAAAQQAADAATAKLNQLVADLADCIKKYCQTLSTADALNALGLPYPDLDTLQDPLSVNGVGGGDRDAPFQLMIIEIRAGGLPGLTVPGAPAPRASQGVWRGKLQPQTAIAALLSLLRPNARMSLSAGTRWPGADGDRLTMDEPMIRQRGRPTPAPPVQMFLTSLGESTGRAFSADIFNGTGHPLRLAGHALVVEPLKDEAKRQVQSRLQGLMKTAGPSSLTTRLDGYCLEYLRLPPTPGSIFRVASQELQQRFAPMRRVLDASRQLQAAAQLHPDSEPGGYFHSIRQWSVWTLEQRFNNATFTQAFVEHTKKIVTAQKRAWSPEVEKVVRGAAPGRWADIQRVLAAAQIAPAGPR